MLYIHSNNPDIQEEEAGVKVICSYIRFETTSLGYMRPRLNNNNNKSHTQDVI